jgi:hypothetical protein
MANDIFPHPSHEIADARRRLAPDIDDAFTDFSERLPMVRCRLRPSN